jgi:LmbE family N-acetylglucosaminyl deacetylase
MKEERTFMDILWSLAHPDDESFGGAGTIAWAAKNGLTTGLVCATRGEVGEISEARLGTPATLGAVREQELRGAMNEVGLTELRLLGYRDSGMAGTKENDDPRAFVQAPREEALAHIIAQIRELKPETVITFGPDGGYGHPDHVYIGSLTDEAVLRAADSDQPGLGNPWQVRALYHAAIPREALIAFVKSPDGPFRSMSEEQIQQLGTPSSEITHWVDTIDFIAISRATVMHHLTQIPVAARARFDDDNRLRYQTFVRQPLPWDGDTPPFDAIDRLQKEHPNTTRSIGF